MAFLYPDYFPFCITEGGEVGNNTSHPVGMPLEDAMDLYWKPKKIRIVESWDTRWGDGDEFDVTVNGSTNVSFSTGRSKMSEAICHPFDTIITGNAGTFIKVNPAATPPTPGPVTDLLTLQLFLESPYVILQDDLYYPLIYFSRASSDANQYWEWSSIGPAIYPFYQAEIKINGNSYPFQMYSTAADAAISTNCSSIITIDEERDAE
jgi:hypothetical protein